MRWLSIIALSGVLASTSFGSDTNLLEIHVVDKETGRGIPMIELTTVDDVSFITDSAGRIALNAGEFSGQTVFFRLSAAGYQVPKDGFGIEGVRLTFSAGSPQTIELRRTQIAERLYRITGRNLYVDTIRLGHAAPIRNPFGSGQVIGQDSVQTAVFEGRMHWFWGDTNRLSYPLGLFRTAGATSALAGQPGTTPSAGIDLEYYTSAEGFARAMADVPVREGVVWIHGLCVVKDDAGHPQMVTQYSRRKGLAEPLEQGHLIWNTEHERFDVLDQIELSESWRILQDHPFHLVENGTDYVCFGRPFPTTRVPATISAIRGRNLWQSWTCASDDGSRPVRDSKGTLQWRWADAPPVTQKEELQWLKTGLIRSEEARFLPCDADQPQRHVLMHAGSVFFNSHRNRWVMIGNELAWDKSSPSHLGEVYYSEADDPEGPWRVAIKVATHPGQSFYNPLHHVEFDEENGRLIYFEGTYTNMFTQSQATPLYNYNQIMYRMDLSDERIVKVFGLPRSSRTVD